MNSTINLIGCLYLLIDIITGDDKQPWPKFNAVICFYENRRKNRQKYDLKPKVRYLFTQGPITDEITLKVLFRSNCINGNQCM